MRYNQRSPSGLIDSSFLKVALRKSIVIVFHIILSLPVRTAIAGISLY